MTTLLRQFNLPIFNARQGLESQNLSSPLAQVSAYARDFLWRAAS